MAKHRVLLVRLRAFSFHHYLSFVEIFVESMQSHKYLIFNTTFCIFNKSTKIWGFVSFLYNMTNPQQAKYMLQYLFTTVRQRQTNQQARVHSAKGGCSSTELQDNDTTFLFCPVQLLHDGVPKPNSTIRAYTEAKSNNHRGECKINCVRL